MYCKRKQESNMIPPEIDLLKRNKSFQKFSEEDLMAYYHQFKNVTNGKVYLDKDGFIQILHSFNIFPNLKIAERLFRIVDSDNSGWIDFVEFMKYIFLLLEADRVKKTKFVFQMIALQKSQFDFEDLKNFYILINHEDFGEEEENERFHNEEEEMAILVYEMLRKKKDLKVSFQEFQNFIDENENHLKLFNFLRGDAESSRKDVRLKRNYLTLLNMMDSLIKDIDYLQQLINPQNDIETKQPFNRKDTHIKRIVKSLKNIMLKKRESELIKKQQKKFEKKISSSKDLFESSMMSSKYHEGQQNGQQRLGKVLKSMKIKAQRINKNLIKEIDLITQKETLDDQIKSDFNAKKQNENKKIVFINDPNWNLVTTMITGIVKSVSNVQSNKFHVLSKQDFHSKNTFEIDALYSTKFEKVKFKDYSSYVFENIRRQFGIGADQFLRSIGINTFKNAFFDKLFLMLQESSSGKSGSFFFHSADGKFMIKTIKQDEFKVLKQILPSYYEHLLLNPNTLITRYYGLYKMKCYNNNKVVYNIYICVMNNVFDIWNPEKINFKYDLKGSTYQRLTDIEDIKKGQARKDQNFINERQCINITYSIWEQLLMQLAKDSQFLAEASIIDYSLLCGIIDKEDDDEEHLKPLFNIKNVYPEVKTKSRIVRKLSKNSKRTFLEDSMGKKHYYIGIIDTLTFFGIRKKSEYVAKRVVQGKGISCVPPLQYQQRFYDFISNILTTKND